MLFALYSDWSKNICGLWTPIASADCFVCPFTFRFVRTSVRYNNQVLSIYHSSKNLLHLCLCVCVCLCARRSKCVWVCVSHNLIYYYSISFNTTTGNSLYSCYFCWRRGNSTGYLMILVVQSEIIIIYWPNSNRLNILYNIVGEWKYETQLVIHFTICIYFK